MRKPLGLYLHFPFCVRKCRYCDFLSFPAGEAERAAYLARLMEEMAWRGPQYGEYEIKTLFLGGGTPSLMDGRQASALMAVLHRHFHVSPDAEMTIECNPGTVDGEKLSAYKKAGFNRLSFGLQSMKDEELRYLGRIHRAGDFLDNFSAARREGFDNINIDLMSALPGQSVDSWLETLRAAAELEPEHISAYSLIIEEGTPFFELYGEEEGPVGAGAGHSTIHPNGGFADDQGQRDKNSGYLPLPDEDSERRMYHLTREELDKRGYLRYEISNYARPGRECRHNLTYWYRGDYLGLGLGASSLVGERRFSNTREMKKYMGAFPAEEKEGTPFEIENEERLDCRAQMEETMFLGLRCMAGVDLTAFERRFGRSALTVYGSVIRKYTQQGFLKLSEDGRRLALTEKGIDVSSWILADFLL